MLRIWYATAFLIPLAAAQVEPEGAAGSATTRPAIAKADQAGVLRSVATLIRRHVTFRPDGNATAFFRTKEKHLLVEWKRLQAVEVHASGEGTFQVRFQAAAWRAGESGGTWSAWTPGGLAEFPAIVTVTRNEDGSHTATAKELAAFTPGPGAEDTGVRRNSMPAAKMGDGLKNFR